MYILALGFFCCCCWTIVLRHVRCRLFLLSFVKRVVQVYQLNQLRMKQTSTTIEFYFLIALY